MSGDSQSAARIEVPAPHCANCHAPLAGPFCAQCGQPHETHRGSVLGLLHDFIGDIVSFDSRILRTVTALLFQPGELACAFRQGRTQPYVPPVRLYLFVSLLFFLALSVSRIALLQIGLQPVPASVARMVHTTSVSAQLIVFHRLGSVHSQLSADDELKLKLSAQKARKSALNHTLVGTFERLEQDPAALNGALTEWVPRVLFLLLPLFALLLALFYRGRKQDYFFVDHMVFSLGIHSFAFIALLAAMALAQFLSGRAVAALLMAVIGLYLLFAMRRFYGEGWGWTVVKFTGLSLVYGAVVLVPACFAIIALSIFGPGASA